MPEVISTTERTDISPLVKDGYLMLYIYLPLVFGQDFAPYIGKITHPILKALADENEFVSLDFQFVFYATHFLIFIFHLGT